MGVGVGAAPQQARGGVGWGWGGGGSHATRRRDRHSLYSPALAKDLSPTICPLIRLFTCVLFFLFDSSFDSPLAKLRLGLRVDTQYDPFPHTPEVT